MKKTVVLDFDGVIHSYVSKWVVWNGLYSRPDCSSY